MRREQFEVGCLCRCDVGVCECDVAVVRTGFETDRSACEQRCVDVRRQVADAGSVLTGMQCDRTGRRCAVRTSDAVRDAEVTTGASCDVLQRFEWPVDAQVSSGGQSEIAIAADRAVVIDEDFARFSKREIATGCNRNGTVGE